MGGQIHSKIHRAIELAKAGEMYLPATHNALSLKDGGNATHISELPDHDVTALILIGGMQTVAKSPTFVISDSVCKMMEGRLGDLQKSMVDLREADLLSLPFPVMNVEFDYSTPDGTKVRGIVHMEDLHDEEVVAGLRKHPEEEIAKNTAFAKISQEFLNLMDDGYDLLVEIYRIERDQHGEYLIVSPNYTFMSIVRGSDGMPWVRSAARTFEHFKNTPQLDSISSAVQKRDAHVGMYGYLCATLIYNTQGIEREKVECEKLNKKRKASGKPSIAQHHYLYIDRVYRSSDSADGTSEKYDERKHPRPHWRKAHVRGVRHGKGRTEIRLVKIEARIIAWNGKGPEPEKPSGTTIVKTRAKKK